MQFSVQTPIWDSDFFFLFSLWYWKTSLVYGNVWQYLYSLIHLTLSALVTENCLLRKGKDLHLNEVAKSTNRFQHNYRNFTRFVRANYLKNFCCTVTDYFFLLKIEAKHLLKFVINILRRPVVNYRCLSVKHPSLKQDQNRKKACALRSDCNLFSRLYTATQHRSGDLDEFFMHENQPHPLSLSEFGNLRLGKKSDSWLALSLQDLRWSSYCSCPSFDNCFHL